MISFMISLLMLVLSPFTVSAFICWRSKYTMLLMIIIGLGAGYLLYLAIRPIPVPPGFETIEFVSIHDDCQSSLQIGVRSAKPTPYTLNHHDAVFLSNTGIAQAMPACDTIRIDIYGWAITVVPACSDLGFRAAVYIENIEDISGCDLYYRVFINEDKVKGDNPYPLWDKSEMKIIFREDCFLSEAVEISLRPIVGCEG